MFERLSRYPISVRVFPDPILFLAGLKPLWEHGQQRPAIMVGGKEMAFRNFIYTEDVDDLAFLPKEPSLGFGIGSPSALVNTKPPKDVEEPEVQPPEVTTDSGESLKADVFVVHPGSVDSHIKERKCKIKGGLPNCFELKDANVCHLKISAITPPAWKGYLDNQMDLELLDLFDRCYARQVVMDNAVNRRAREFLQVIKKMSGEADVIKARERSHEDECEGLQVKCEAAMAEFDQNPDVLALREKISSLTADVKEQKEPNKARLKAVEASLHKEVEELKQDRKDVVSKVVPYAAMKLVHSYKLGMLVGKLVSSAITYGRCRAYEQGSNDFATATFPWLDEFVADATALIETLLSKKPPMLQKPAPSRTQMPVPSSRKVTPSSASSLNPMYPPADPVKPSLCPLE
uniref:Uncharacterized protein n=1 Tax=Tanacetum cinerariifolium TaxID=118510 RepID=A0A699HWV1_TANCI|nr:hypothetical protein [Tanacetum cinerariifolium]